MTVVVNSVGTGVEISWEPMGSGDVGGTPPGEFPPYPDNSLPGEQPYPDQGLPGDQPRPDQGLPGEQPRPSHPIYLPPYLDNSLPGNQPVIDNSLPEIEEIGLSDEQIEKLKAFLEGNLPDTGGPPTVNPVGGKQIAVQVFGQGQDGDWSNTPVMPNDGLALLRYPKGFTGESYIEVRALDGALIDSGTIQVGEAQE
jgi:hypothetical protein